MVSAAPPLTILPLKSSVQERTKLNSVTILYNNNQRQLDPHTSINCAIAATKQKARAVAPSTFDSSTAAPVSKNEYSSPSEYQVRLYSRNTFPSKLFVLATICQFSSRVVLRPTTASPSINKSVQLSGPLNSFSTANLQSTYLSARFPSNSFPSRLYALRIWFFRLIGTAFEIIRPPATLEKHLAANASVVPSPWKYQLLYPLTISLVDFFPIELLYACWIIFLRVIGTYFEIIRPPATSKTLLGSWDFCLPFSLSIPIIVSTRNLPYQFPSQLNQRTHVWYYSSGLI